jgi:DNA-binding ferritin-like protein
MEIEIAQITQNNDQSIPTFGDITDSLDSTRVFGLFLSKALVTLHMVHWYVLNYDAHVILGDLYDDLDSKFDKLQEEIIGTSRETGALFPMTSPNIFDLENISQFKDNTSRIIDTYHWLNKTVVNVLTSSEFKGYTSQVKSGIQNTVDDILSKFNKANYLLSMVKD